MPEDNSSTVTIQAWQYEIMADALGACRRWSHVRPDNTVHNTLAQLGYTPEQIAWVEGIASSAARFVAKMGEFIDLC